MNLFDFLGPAPTKQDLKFAWRLTVVRRARGKCQRCGLARPLDACHIEARHIRPDLTYDPKNGVALCRSCHMRHDHARGHRPSGRPLGMKHTDATKRKIGESNRIAKSTPEQRAFWRNVALRMWDKKGRKHDHTKNCDACGDSLTSRQRTNGSRFCSSACHYRFRVGKPRSGY